ARAKSKPPAVESKNRCIVAMVTFAGWRWFGSEPPIGGRPQEALQELGLSTDLAVIFMVSAALRDGDQETEAHAEGFIVGVAEAVVVSRFDEPAEFMLAAWPVHEIECGFAGQGVAGDAEGAGVNPLGADADHELGLLRKRPGLLQEQVRVPFDGVAGEERRGSHFDFEPVFDGGKL